MMSTHQKNTKEKVSFQSLFSNGVGASLLSYVLSTRFNTIVSLIKNVDVI